MIPVESLKSFGAQGSASLLSLMSSPTPVRLWIERYHICCGAQPLLSLSWDQRPRKYRALDFVPGNTRQLLINFKGKLGYL